MYISDMISLSSHRMYLVGPIIDLPRKAENAHSEEEADTSQADENWEHSS